MPNLMRTGKVTSETAAATAARAATITLRVDVLETEHEVYVLADMPGITTDQVDIRFEKGELSLHGRRSPSHTDKETPYQVYEGANYYRAFAVAETIAADKISAELKGGILTVKLPKVEAVKPRRIAVKG